MSLINQVAAQVACAQANLPPDGPAMDRYIESMAMAIIRREERTKPVETGTEPGVFIEFVRRVYRSVIEGTAKTTQSAAAPAAPKQRYYESKGFFRK